jgi:hypothetical protein
MGHRDMKTPNSGGKVVDTFAKKRRGAAKSDRPSSMSLSEEGSFVSCIDVYATNRSTFLQGIAVEEKAKN